MNDDSNPQFANVARSASLDEAPRHGEMARQAEPQVAKKVARKSAGIAHELPSAELATCTAAPKSPQMHTI
jgi:hypothetical protein